ncbi:MAG: radical SAM protein [Halobacteriovoraceae bacterium]|nr:radical SAM protein [Halobacteriovoraceae bacterium]
MFKRIHIEISNICNVQCSFCPVVERPKDILSPTDFRKIIKQSVPLTEDVCLHLMGEPLAHPEIEEILTIAKNEGAQLQITTNGILIKKLTDLILEGQAVRQINFSLQAFRDNFPDKPLAPYLLPILEFSKRAMLERPDLYINFRLWNFGVESFSKNEELISFIEEYLNVSVKRDVDPGGIKSKKLFKDKRLYFHFDSRFDWPSPDFPPRTEVGTCHGMRNHIGIHADGTVVPCCLDKEAVINLGNCLDEKLETILNSERAVSIKEGFEQNKLVEDLCQKCTFIKRFDSKIKTN